jgi:hypothetical protein
MGPIIGERGCGAREPCAARAVIMAMPIATASSTLAAPKLGSPRAFPSDQPTARIALSPPSVPGTGILDCTGAVQSVRIVMSVSAAVVA